MRRVMRIACGLAGLGLLFAYGLLVQGCSDPDRAILARLDPADQQRFRSGRAVAQPCWTCHDLAGRVKKIGPSLLGLYGRRAGEGEHASDAMRASGIVWDDASLARFLSDPSGVVPGTSMVSAGVQGPALGELLFYLRHVTRPGARDASSGLPEASAPRVAGEPVAGPGASRGGPSPSAAVLD